MPILYSCHPCSKKRLAQTGFKLDKRVVMYEPSGFHDYNCLKMNAFVFGLIMITFCIVYIIIASTLVYRYASKTFRLRQ